jgi:uncharacterized protein with GYD domain
MMATFITLVTFTDQGIRNVKETLNRAEKAREMAQKFGVEMTDIYWTLGQYDLVVTSNSSDDASATAFSLALGSAGNVRTQTLRAFSKDDMKDILSKMP